MNSTQNSTGIQYLVLDHELLQCNELTLHEKLVLAYIDQVLPYAAPGETCEEYLDLSTNEVNRARRHLFELGLIESEDA